MLNINMEFWNNWYFRDDVHKWVKAEEDLEFFWMIDVPPDELPEEFKNKFEHNRDIKAIFKKTWGIINSLPVREEEKGLQNWQLNGIILDHKDIDTVETVFYESHFDIYREIHIILRKYNKNYTVLESFYEPA